MVVAEQSSASVSISDYQFYGDALMWIVHKIYSTHGVWYLKMIYAEVIVVKLVIRQGNVLCLHRRADVIM